MTKKKIRRILNDLDEEFESKTLDYWYEVELPLTFERCFGGETVTVQIEYWSETDQEVLLLLCVDADDARYGLSEEIRVPKVGQESSVREFRGDAVIKKRFHDILAELEEGFCRKPAEYWEQARLAEGLELSAKDDIVQVTIASLVESDEYAQIGLRGNPRGEISPQFSASIWVSKARKETDAAD